MFLNLSYVISTEDLYNIKNLINMESSKTMKRKYEKPLMQVEVFEANEYIAACWKMTCNVPRHIHWPDNTATGYAHNIEGERPDTKVKGYGCGATYNVKTNGEEEPKVNAKWTTDTWRKIDQSSYNGGIYLWNNKHFTKANTWLRDTTNAS